MMRCVMMINVFFRLNPKLVCDFFYEIEMKDENKIKKKSKVVISDEDD